MFDLAPELTEGGQKGQVLPAADQGDSRSGQANRVDRKGATVLPSCWSHHVNLYQLILLNRHMVIWSISRSVTKVFRVKEIIVHMCGLNTQILSSPHWLIFNWTIILYQLMVPNFHRKVKLYRRNCQSALKWYITVECVLCWGFHVERKLKCVKCPWHCPWQPWTIVHVQSESWKPDRIESTSRKQLSESAIWLNVSMSNSGRDYLGFLLSVGYASAS